MNCMLTFAGSTVEPGASIHSTGTSAVRYPSLWAR